MRSLNSNYCFNASLSDFNKMDRFAGMNQADQAPVLIGLWTRVCHPGADCYSARTTWRRLILTKISLSDDNMKQAVIFSVFWNMRIEFYQTSCPYPPPVRRP